ncbi:hypothetical protein [Vibrio tetraodonis]|uniref:hypothetical protein n=1 Tax=Vibrio tetraodonis TaxID=2231647 RepID=UPI000E0C8B6B|nr:hypothetical protein [Vibrio tetraodonis]
MPSNVIGTSYQVISESRLENGIEEHSKEKANHEDVWRGIKDWFSSEEKAKDALYSIFHDYEVNKNNKLLNFEQLKYMCSEGYKDKFSAEYINDEIELSIYIEDKNINVFKGKLKDERVLKNLDVAAGHPKDFYIDGKEIYKIISPAEQEGIKSLKTDRDSTPAVETVSLEKSKELPLRVRKDNENFHLE